MRGSSINFKPSKQGALEHNDRTEEDEVEYLLPHKFRLKNEFDLSAVEAKSKIGNLLVEANENTLKTIGQELQAKSYLWEAVINLNQNHSLKNLKKLIKRLEQLTGFTSVQAAIHRDEGREGKDKNGNHIVLYNYHAHVTFFTLDRSNGLQLYRRDISKPLRKEYRRKVESYRSVHKRLIPLYHPNKIMKLKKKPKWSEANMLEINKEIRRRFKKDGHIVYDRERLSFLQTVVADELNMPRGTVSVEAEARRLGVTLEPMPAVRKEHKQYKAERRLEEQIIETHLSENIINERVHKKNIADLKNSLDYVQGLVRTLLSEKGSMKNQLKNKDAELVEINKAVPKENEVIIDKSLYREVENIQESFNHFNSKGLYKKILDAKEDQSNVYEGQISELEKQIEELKEDVYSDRHIYLKGKKTTFKYKYKNLLSGKEKTIEKQKSKIEELEDGLRKKDEQLDRRISVFEEKQTIARERIEGRDRLYDQLLKKYTKSEKIIEEQSVKIESLNNKNQEFEKYIKPNANEVVGQSISETILENDIKVKEEIGGEKNIKESYENKFKNMDSEIDIQEDDNLTNKSNSSMQ